MNWTSLTFTILTTYITYYTVNIFIDLTKSKKLKKSEDNTLIEFEETVEAQDVTENFLEIKKEVTSNIEDEEEPITVNIKEETKDSQETKSLVETKKKESNQEENLQEKESEKKDNEDVKFQSMPVNEFLANAKKFSSQIDF